jgi:hypothetical protein
LFSPEKCAEAHQRAYTRAVSFRRGRYGGRTRRPSLV